MLEKEDQKQSAFFGRLMLVAGGAMLLAAVVYASTLANYVFPGESARLLAQWGGMDSVEFPEHAVWGVVVRFVATLAAGASVAVKLNMISLVCGVVAAGLLAVVVGFFVHQSAESEATSPFARSAAYVAASVSAFALIFSTAVWQSASHLEYRMFDVCFALLGFLIFVPMRTRKVLAGGFGWPLILGALVALGFIESPIFAALFPVYLFALIVVSMRTGRSYYVSVGSFLGSFAVVFLVAFMILQANYTGTAAAIAGGYAGGMDVFGELLSRDMHEIRLWLSRPGWLYVMLFSVLPFIACGFASARGLNNERTWSQYAFHGAMTLCLILATATPFAPEALLKEWGISPVATSTLVAVVAGYLAAYWYLLVRAQGPKKDYEGDRFVKHLGTYLGRVMLVIIPLVLVLAALVNAFSCTRARGAFADTCANEILDRLGTRTWFVTDGMLDDHLRVQAAMRGQELNLICLQRDMNDTYLKELGALVKEKKLTAGRANLGMSVQLGVLPFIQDWFMGDTNVINEVAIFGVPDFWYMAEKIPASNAIFFNGVRAARDVNGLQALKDFKEFWGRMEKVLWADKKGSRAIRHEEDPVNILRLQLRRHVGFVANNLGVLMQDLGLNDEAFELYELVLKEIDPDNICSLFNEFEMARANIKCAVPHKNAIEKQLRAIVDDPKRRYVLWSLSRYYGYIRSPEIFARMGYAWARSGQTGNAIAQVQRAIDFVPANRQAGLLNMMAAIYASGNDAKKSRETYQRVLSADATNHDALLGMTRLALQAGDLNDAKAFLTKAVKAGGSEASTGFDWALLHLMNNDLVAARLALQKVTDTQPKSLQAWALLAGVVLQQIDQEKDEKAKKKSMEELETVILPRMETIAEGPRDYYVQMTRALVLMRKGTAFRKAARDALVAAATTRPDVAVTGDMILNLDIEMDDGASAERDARRILRRDRHNKLANYVMGSLRLKDGDYTTAETFLRISVEDEHPLAAAQNDLAETLRRLQNYDEAEKYARDAVKTAPDLYVAWETLGSTLLDANKNLDEAEKCVRKAIELTKTVNKIEDIRMQITLARVQIARGDMGRARTTLGQLRKRQGELSNYDRNELEKLIRSTRTK